MKFEDSHKIVKDILDGNNFIPFGVSEVKVVIASVGKTDAGSEYMEIHVVDQEDREDSARMWFTTEKAANYAFNILRGIVTHQGKTEEAKAKLAAKVDKVQDTDELAALINEVCVGKKIWFTKYYDESRTYLNTKGETRKQINRNVYGYEPKERPELMPKPQEESAPAERTDVPFESPSDAPAPSAEIPAKGDWSS